MVEIRTLHPDEWELYRTVRLESLERDPQAFGATYGETLARPEAYWRSRLEHGLADPARTLIFALEDGLPIGLVGFNPNEKEGVVDVISMYVSASFRGLGLGRRLLQELMARLADMLGVRELELIVHPTQTAALALYKSLGFKVVEKIHTRRADGTPLERWRMRKQCGSNCLEAG